MARKKQIVEASDFTGHKGGDREVSALCPVSVTLRDGRTVNALAGDLRWPWIRDREGYITSDMRDIMLWRVREGVHVPL